MFTPYLLLVYQTALTHFPNLGPMRRALLGLALTLGMILLGFALGGLVAAEFLVSQGDSLAGAATVAMFCLGGAMAGLLAGIVMARRVSERALPRVAIMTLLLGCASFGIAWWRGVARRESAPSSSSSGGGGGGGAGGGSSGGGGAGGW